MMHVLIQPPEGRRQRQLLLPVGKTAQAPSYRIGFSLRLPYRWCWVVVWSGHFWFVDWRS